ncbi:hypothetical protein DL96DRAFT_1591941 [Flagelloscypha sp. PMI_526]|nr:hypothetical protein DL96DRAFT_1591941 [Flagelloscypha sp. PMI_526]
MGPTFVRWKVEGAAPQPPPLIVSSRKSLLPWIRIPESTIRFPSWYTILTLLTYAIFVLCLHTAMSLPNLVKTLVGVYIFVAFPFGLFVACFPPPAPERWTYMPSLFGHAILAYAVLLLTEQSTEIENYPFVELSHLTSWRITLGVLAAWSSLFCAAKIWDSTPTSRGQVFESVEKGIQRAYGRCNVLLLKIPQLSTTDRLLDPEAECEA